MDHEGKEIDRRSFLKNASVGIATGGFAGLASRAARPSAAADSSTVAQVTTDEERAMLSAEAHFGRKKPASSRRGMAISSHPIATREAVKILREGGSACDAALCAAITQTVLEPHMTSITGVLNMLHYDATRAETTYVNATQNAPLAPLGSLTPADVRGGRGVGVPGYWAGFEEAHSRHGRVPIKRIMAPAIRYARHGFEIHPFLWGEIYRHCETIGGSAQGREIYMPDKALPRPGDMLYQKRAADTLERLAEEGGEYFYRGSFAEEFCRVVQEAGGVISRDDMEAYRARWLEPAVGTYRGYDIKASPPPDSGGTHVIEALNMIELMDLQRLGPPTESAETLGMMVRILHEVFTAGAKFNDPESHPVPMDVILSKEYASMRLRLLQMDVPRAVAAPTPGSNHVTVVDGQGNVATLLHSAVAELWINGLFACGVHVVASGAFFMRTMPRPGCRATVYDAPNIVFKNGRPILASGSPSISLIQNVVQNTVNILDFGVPIDESVHRPRFGAQIEEVPGAFLIEADLDAEVRRGAEATGLRFAVVNPWNWHHGSFEGIFIDPDTGALSACADPRRCGSAEGV